MSSLVIKLTDIKKSYKSGEHTQNILNGINLELHKGEVTALLGVSGSGKSTLLNIMGLLDKPSSGKLEIDGVDCSKISDKKQSELRKSKIGFVFQFHHLLADFLAIENVMLPNLLFNKKSAAKEKAEEILIKVGLKDKLNKYPSQLSGGEKQRVAIARALVNDPSFIIADEPTGNLDPALSTEICDLIVDLTKKYNGVAIIATHNMELANRINKKIILQDRKLIIQ